MQDRRTFLKNLGAAGLFAASCKAVVEAAEYEEAEQSCYRPTHSVTVSNAPAGTAELPETYESEDTVGGNETGNTSAFNTSVFNASDDRGNLDACPYGQRYSD